MKTKNIKDFPLYDTNPWDPEGICQRIKIKGTMDQVVTNNAGESFVLTPAVKIKGVFMKDNFPFRKLFVKYLDNVKALSSPGLRMFCYILTAVERNIDEIRIDTGRAMEFCEYKSMSQYYAGITNLLVNDFLVRKSDDRMTYFININIFFNGDRGKMMMDRDTENQE